MENIKTSICSFWEKGTCHYMNNSRLCLYAHGENELQSIECKFRSKCFNPVCKYNHGSFLPQIKNKIYANEIPITIKKKIKKNKFNNKDIKIYNNIVNDKNVNNIDKQKEDNILNDSLYLNKLLNYVDEFYINKIETKFIKFGNIISNLKDKINILNNIIEEKNNKIHELENINSTTNIKYGINIKVQNEYENYNIKNINDIESNIYRNIYKEHKLEKIYKKWESVYNIFQKYNFNYKIINKHIKEVNQYIKDKNIYKIKGRCCKIYNFYNKLKKNEIHEYLPISKIIHLKI